MEQIGDGRVDETIHRFSTDPRRAARRRGFDGRLVEKPLAAQGIEDRLPFRGDEGARRKASQSAYEHARARYRLSSPASAISSCVTSARTIGGTAWWQRARPRDSCGACRHTILSTILPISSPENARSDCVWRFPSAPASSAACVNARPTWGLRSSIYILSASVTCSRRDTRLVGSSRRAG